MIVIFGASGFVGQALCRHLDTQKTLYLDPNFDLTQNIAPDIIANIVNNGDTIIMIAALTGEHGEAYHLTDYNIRMAANVIRGCKGKHIAHCVYVSSDSVYGNPEGIISEITPLMPASLYGHMHLMREQMFQENFDSLTILRPCAIYGLGDTHNAYGINQFLRSAFETGEITLFGNGEEIRSNVHVNDVAEVIAIAAQESIQGIFNVNNDAVHTFSDVADFIQRSLKEKDIKITTKPRTHPITHRYVNNDHLRRVFITPRNTFDGIEKMIANYENTV